MKTDTHVDTTNDMVQFDERNWETVNGGIDRHRDHGTHYNHSLAGQDHAN
jgi:hypothetical protein